MTADTRLLALVTNAVAFGFCLCLWAITGAGIAGRVTGPRTIGPPAAVQPRYRWQLAILAAIVAGMLLVGWLVSRGLG